MVTGLLRFLLSGAQHPTSGVVACESDYDYGIVAWSCCPEMEKVKPFSGSNSCNRSSGQEGRRDST